MSRTEFDGDAHLTDLAGAARVIAVEAHLGREVEGHGEPRLTLGKQVAETRIGIARGAVARVLADAPEPPAIHGGLDPAGEGRHPGESLLAQRVVGVQVGRRVDRVHRNSASGLERILALPPGPRGLENGVLPLEERLDEVRFSRFHRDGRRRIRFGGHRRSISLCHERANSAVRVRNLCNTRPQWHFR